MNDIGFGGASQGQIVNPSNPGLPLPLLDIIPSTLLSLQSREAIKRNSIKIALDRAVEKRIINSNWSNAVIRQIRPTTDLTWGANANQDWLTAALVSGTLNSFINSVTLPVNQLIVFYALSTYEPSPSISELTFSRGTGGTGGLNLRVNLQRLYDMLEPEGYFSKGVLYDPADIMFVQGLPFKANALGERYIMHGYVVEPVGQTVAAPPM